MTADRFGAQTRVKPGGDRPAVSASERTPLLRATGSSASQPHISGSGSTGAAAAAAAAILKRHERGDGEDERLLAGDGGDGGADGNQEEETTVLAEEVSFSKLCLIMGTAYLGVFLGAIDSSIIATLSAPISSEFQSLSLLSWLATAYLISNAACQPISGRLTDIFGRGPGLVFSNVFFAAGNLICGLSQSSSVMILGRVVAGIGGGGLMSISTFLGSDLIPLRNRGIAQGIGNICYGSGSMMGGVFGGLMNDHTKLGWRLAFLIQVPPALISAVAVAILVRVPPKQSDKSYLARIDFGGVFFTVSFLVLLLLGVNAGGNLVPWTHPLPLTTIPLSIVAFISFLWWESRAVQPIIPVRLLLDRTLLSACLCNFLSTMVALSGVFYVPLYLQVRGDSPTMAGLKILPSPVGISICSVGAGYIMKKTGRYVWLGISSLLMMISGILIFTTQTETSPGWVTMSAFFLTGGGYGAMLTTTLLACIAAVDHSQQAVITSATYLARSLGGTIGITAGSAVYQNILNSRLWQRFGDEPHAAEIIQKIRDDLNFLKHLPKGWHDGVLSSFMEAFRGVWLTMLALAIGALICVSLMRQHILHETLSRRNSQLILFSIAPMSTTLLSPELISFELTPIEHNGNRRYKRVAIVLPLSLSGNDLYGETTMIEQCTLRALFDTIVAWPILGGCVRVSGERYGKLTMLARVPSTYTQPRTDLMDIHVPSANNPGVEELISQVCANSLGKDFFPSERALNLGTGMPVVMVKLTFLATHLVMGFSFYEVVTDGESISRFFSWLNDLSWITTGSGGSWIHRSPLQPVQPGEVNRNMFPFYDWSNRRPAQGAPRDRLVCRVVDFKKHQVLNFIRRIHRAVDSSSHNLNLKNEDYLVAILWVAIMHARFSKRRVTSQDKARLNILLPGEPQARRAQERDWSYFGSSTVPTVAELSVENLVFAVDHPNSSFRDMALCIYSIRGLAEAACAIRKAINTVDRDYVRHLMGLKETVHPEADWAAYERGIDRHTTGTTFEDWSGYFENKRIGIPFTTGQALRVLPCADNLEEGKIILLPQPHLGGRGNEIGWSAWLCLEKEVMDVVLGQLDIQDWMAGGSDFDMNTAGGF
ncbi:mfs multidrug transporter [Trichoderma arundinaceum]|uniref:Mfs multidrug transporter n=1 Tax=Trichoderma arundinaceum TaxID=490622 RepID=A0A395NB82_TRIAR|nr:mfs multidrug transporter [Trichoderma arundinaceum]